jgi:hypothetical protein
MELIIATINLFFAFRYRTFHSAPMAAKTNFMQLRPMTLITITLRACVK